MDGRHGYLTPIVHNGVSQAAGQGIHRPFQWEAADAAARAAITGAVADDVGKFCLQVDNWSVWILTDESPITWLQIGNFVAGDYYTKTEIQTDGQAIVHWGNLSNKGSVDELSDVDTTTGPPDIGQGLIWDGVNWVPGAAGGGSFDNILVDGNGDVLTDGENVLYVE